MLAALEIADRRIVEMWRSLCQHENEGNRMSDQDPVLRQVRAAIRAATGEV